MNSSNAMVPLISETYRQVHQQLASFQGASPAEMQMAAVVPVTEAISRLSDEDAEDFAHDFSLLAFMPARESMLQPLGTWTDVPLKVIKGCSKASGLTADEVDSLFEKIRMADKRQVEMGFPGVIAAASLPHFLGVADRSIASLEARVNTGNGLR